MPRPRETNKGLVTPPAININSDNEVSAPSLFLFKKEVIKNEQTFLRAELQELKRCQLQYFISSVAGTGIIFGLLDKLDKPENAIFFLAPLIILIPCWWTFFDKATTITRLVGYSRLLEKQLVSSDPIYIGYENALREFRRLENEAQIKRTSLKEKLKKTLSMLRLGTRHRYWIINWYTYFSLALVCCLLPTYKFQISLLPFTFEKIPIWIAIGMTLWSTIYTLHIVYHLTHGNCSYLSYSTHWEKVEEVIKTKIRNGEFNNANIEA